MSVPAGRKLKIWIGHDYGGRRYVSKERGPSSKSAVYTFVSRTHSPLTKLTIQLNVELSKSLPQYLRHSTQHLFYRRRVGFREISF